MICGGVDWGFFCWKYLGMIGRLSFRGEYNICF